MTSTTSRSLSADWPRPAGPGARALLRSVPTAIGIFRDPIGFVSRRFDAYGDIYDVPNGDGGLYVVRHPDHAADVLVTHASKFDTSRARRRRRWPRPLGSGARRARGDAKIGDYMVRAGSEVVIWIDRMHRHPRFDPEPERFMPERFTEANEALRPKHAYLPFGGGARIGIGKAFAMLEAELVLATPGAAIPVCAWRGSTG